MHECSKFCLLTATFKLGPSLPASKLAFATNASGRSKTATVHPISAFTTATSLMNGEELPNLETSLASEVHKSILLSAVLHTSLSFFLTRAGTKCGISRSRGHRCNATRLFVQVHCPPVLDSQGGTGLNNNSVKSTSGECCCILCSWPSLEAYIARTGCTHR